MDETLAAAQRLLITGQARGLTPAEVASLQPAFAALQAAWEQERQFNEQVVQSDPVAAEVKVTRLFLEKATTALGVLNHVTIPAALEMETQRLRAEEAGHRAVDAAAAVELRKLDRPSVWTPDTIQFATRASGGVLVVVLGWLMMWATGWTALPSVPDLPVMFPPPARIGDPP